MARMVGGYPKLHLRREAISANRGRACLLRPGSRSSSRKVKAGGGGARSLTPLSLALPWSIN